MPSIYLYFMCTYLFPSFFLPLHSLVYRSYCLLRISLSSLPYFFLSSVIPLPFPYFPASSQLFLFLLQYLSFFLHISRYFLPCCSSLSSSFSYPSSVNFPLLFLFLFLPSFNLLSVHTLYFFIIWHGNATTQTRGSVSLYNHSQDVGPVCVGRQTEQPMLRGRRTWKMIHPLSFVTQFSTWYNEVAADDDHHDGNNNDDGLWLIKT